MLTPYVELLSTAGCDDEGLVLRHRKHANGNDKATDSTFLATLTGDYDAADANRAYRAKVKEYHPDISHANGLSNEEASAKMVEINRAKKVIDEALSRGTKARTHASSGAHSSSDSSSGTGTSDAAEADAGSEEEVAGDEQEHQDAPETKPEGTSFAKRVAFLWRRSGNAKAYEFIEMFPYFAVILVAGCVLPFYLFGGLNIVPGWKGVLGPVDYSFLSYVIGPFVSIANAVSKSHPLDMVIRTLFGIVFKVFYVLVFLFKTSDPER